MSEAESPAKLSPREQAFKLLEQLRHERQVAMAFFGLIVIVIAGTQFMLGLVTVGQFPTPPVPIETEPVETGPVTTGSVEEHAEPIEPAAP